MRAICPSVYASILIWSLLHLLASPQVYRDALPCNRPVTRMSDPHASSDVALYNSGFPDNVIEDYEDKRGVESFIKLLLSA